nr:hypothetical protein BaRGS_006684 [Batillaria attramentaria]
MSIAYLTQVEEEDGVKKQRALKAQMEQQQRYGQMEHTNTWTSEDERGRTQRVHTERLQHQEREWQARTQAEQRIIAHHNLPPPPVPPAHYHDQGVHPQQHPSYQAQQYPEYVVQEGRQQYQGYQYPGQGYLPEHAGNPYQQHPPPPPQQQQRPDSGNFPDPPPPEQLLCYEEERVADPHYYSPHPGVAVPPSAQGMMVQPMVVYRAPAHPGQSPVTETVAIRPQDPHNSPHASPRVPAHYQHPHQHPQQFQHQYHQQQLQQDQRQQQQHHQTFPRQTPAHHDPHAYSTFGR